MSTPAPAETDTVAQAAGVAGGVHSPTAGTTTCANCDARLTGKYCSECGQRHHDHPVHDFWHFISEALEDLTHADSRLWQTLTALLFRPGFLTREFLEGRRVRYLPPVRLYLVVSLIFFIIVGLGSQIPKSYVVVSYNGNSFHYQVVPTGKVPGPGAVAGTPAPAASGNAAGAATLTSTPAAREHLCGQFGANVAQHFYVAMRRVYGQGRWLTLSKLAALAVVYFFLGILMILATASYSFLML